MPSVRGSLRRRSSFDVDGKRAQLSDLEREASDPSLWDDPTRGQELTQRLARLRDQVDRYERLDRTLGDLEATDELLEGETDPDLARELATGLEDLERDVEAVELTALLSGPYDDHAAIAKRLEVGLGGGIAVHPIVHRWSDEPG